VVVNFGSLGLIEQTLEFTTAYFDTGHYRLLVVSDAVVLDAGAFAFGAPLPMAFDLAVVG